MKNTLCSSHSAGLNPVTTQNKDRPLRSILCSLLFLRGVGYFCKQETHRGMEQSQRVGKENLKNMVKNKTKRVKVKLHLNYALYRLKITLL